MATDDDDGGKMTLDNWLECWKKPTCDFHSESLNKMFVKHKDTLVPRGGMKVFVPLCGKAVEMKALADNGHHVVGLEASPIACQDFFTENKIPFSKELIGTIPGDVYTSTDTSLAVKLYCCDFFLFSKDIEGGFETIWDSGGLTAMNEEDQERYIEVLKPLMAPGCINLTEFCIFSEWPSGMSDEKLGRCLGEGFTFTLRDDIEAWEEMKAMGISNIKLYLIKKKE